MPHINRRVFLAAAGGAATHLSPLFAAGDSAAVDETLRSGIAHRKIPAVVGMVGSENKTLYAGAFGKRDSSGAPVRVDSIFAIASMTKAVTTVAALQLVEQGKVDLAEPIARHLPQLANLDVLEGFDAAGKPSLRPAKTPITLRHLLTHTSGLCYDTWDGNMFRYASVKPAPNPARPGPLMFEPGTALAIRARPGLGRPPGGGHRRHDVGELFPGKDLPPAGNGGHQLHSSPRRSSTEWFPATTARTAANCNRTSASCPAPPATFNGGGGLYSTAADYVRFMQAILNRGTGPNNTRILQPRTVESMMTNQIGELTAGKMKSFMPDTSADVDIQPGSTEKWGLGFLINTTPYAGGRSAGSLAWAGLYNTFYWIDPARRRCAVILMQYLPFVDREAVGLLGDFERAAYRNL